MPHFMGLQISTRSQWLIVLWASKGLFRAINEMLKMGYGFTGQIAMYQPVKNNPSCRFGEKRAFVYFILTEKGQKGRFQRVFAFFST